MTDTSKLQTIKTPSSLTFEREFRYDISTESDLPRPEPGAFRGLLPGTYIAAYEDEIGIYYRGEGMCVVTMTYPSKGTKYVSEGGVWIEKVATGTPKFRLYRVSESPYRQLPIAPSDSCPPSQTVPPARSQSQEVAVGSNPELDIALASTSPKSSPAQVGLGTGIAAGLIAAIAESEKGKLVLLPAPVGSPQIAGAYRKN